MPFSVTAINTALDGLDESATAGIKYVGLHTVTDPGTGTTANAGEATGGSPAYARVAVVWGAASGAQKSNTGALAIDVPAGSYGFITLWNAATGNSAGNYQGHIPFGGATPLKGFFATDPTMANDTFFADGHGMANGDRVMLFNTFGNALATGVTEGTIYYVVGAATNSFQVSATSGGSAVDLTAVGGGQGYWQRIVPEVFASQGQVTIAASTLALDGTAI